MWKQPSLEVQQKVLHSPFDIETHKNTFVSYLEVVISPEGEVEYAIPSHSEKLVEIFANQKELDIQEAKQYIIETTANNGFMSTVDFLTGVTGYISVWFNGYVAEDPPTKQQLDKLKELYDAGVYNGATYDTVTQKLKDATKELKRLSEEVNGDVQQIHTYSL